MTTAAKLLFTGKTHVTCGPDGAARRERRLSRHQAGRSRTRPPRTCSPPPGRPATSARSASPPPSARSSCRAIRRSTPTIDLSNANVAFFLRARLDVSVPGVDRAVAQELIEAAHGICPYSKAVHGNIEVTTTLV